MCNKELQENKRKNDEFFILYNNKKGRIKWIKY